MSRVARTAPTRSSLQQLPERHCPKCQGARQGMARRARAELLPSATSISYSRCRHRSPISHIRQGRDHDYCQGGAEAVLRSRRSQTSRCPVGPPRCCTPGARRSLTPHVHMIVPAAASRAMARVGCRAGRLLPAGARASRLFRGFHGDARRRSGPGQLQFFGEHAALSIHDYCCYLAPCAKPVGVYSKRHSAAPRRCSLISRATPTRRYLQSPADRSDATAVTLSGRITVKVPAVQGMTLATYEFIRSS